MARLYKNGKLITNLQIIKETILDGDGVPIEISTASEMDALLIEENLGKVYKYVGVSDETYTNGCLYQIVEE